ncbi:acyl-CoA thioesterase [Deinococcus yavapaiensis]|uniref:Acyl-CoA thioester hydrolase n=1 Tax=Deinococcus yavapaiensis KR-236 TaxID=694435 RepID=A0A318SI89_9DEIO|nr:thioesterase family protein [Deinococcus yavapaiensis]PYE51102.1 acyl-CoA thioester hydrolase [Deinococcus yavapaiensis KR-236]
MNFWTVLRVRYAETDQMGVAHHANYPVWFELGRSDLMRALGFSYSEVEARGYYLMLSGLEVQYRRAALYDEELVLQTTIHEARSRKLVFAYRLLRGDELLATGTTTHVPTDKAYRIARIPEDILALLQLEA